MVPREWKKTTLENVLTIGGGKDYKHLKKGPIPVYGSGGHMLNVSDYLYDGESVCIGRKGTIDKPIFLTGKFWTVDTLFYSHSFIDSEPYYIYQFFQTVPWRSLSEASGVPSLSKSIINKVKINLPPLPEQRKIAKILSTWDKAISTTERLIDNSKQQKKALMQQLLTGAHTQRKRLLNDSGEPFEGEWETKNISDAFKVGSSKRVLQADWCDNGVPFYRTRELVSLAKREPFRSEIFISEELFCQISEKYGLPVKSDFLVSGVGTLGVIYKVKNKDRFYFKDGNVLWFKSNGSVESDYFYHCFKSNYIQNQIVNQTTITTVGTYTISNAKQTKFLCPPTVEEQQKIAAVLTNADKEIELLEKQLTDLKQEKKALMQQLLTGKRRVKVGDMEVA